MLWKVYKITNLKNGKIYIGQTKNEIQARFRAHLTAARQGVKFRFYHAIRKHGEDSFKIEELETASTLEEAHRLETEYILKTNSNHPDYGYNGTLGGTGGWMIGRLSKELQEEWREAVTKAVTGEKNPRYCGSTDLDLKNLLIEFANNFGYICGLQSLVGYGLEKGIEVPKSFTKFRFDGGYLNLIKLVEAETGLVYNPYIRGKKRDISSYYKKLSKQKTYTKTIKKEADIKNSWGKIRDSKLYNKNYAFCGTTNEQIIDLLVQYVTEVGIYPSLKKLVAFGDDHGVKVPGKFTSSRFGGKYLNLVEIVEKKTGIQYIPKRIKNGPID